MRDNSALIDLMVSVCNRWTVVCIVVYHFNFNFYAAQL